MYKGKLGYWVSIISIVLVIQFCITIVFPWMGTWFREETITVSANSMTDTGFMEVLGESTLGDFHFHVENNNPDFYFCDSSDEVVKTGYTKYSEALYSPMVLYVRYAVFDNNDGFIRINPSDNSQSPLQIDLYDILEGMENNKEWKDIGVSTKVVKGNINIVIPNERSSYYDAVVDLFYLTLNNLKVPTESEYNLLTPRVNALLEKCEKMVDISKGLVSEYDKHSVDYKVFIGPECLFARGGDETGRNTTDQYNPVYFVKTTYVTMDMYIKDVQDGSDNGLIDEAYNYILSDTAFYRRTGWRLKNSYLNMSYVSYSLPNVVPGFEN